MITSRYLGSPPAPLRTLYCPLEEFSRRASYSTGRLATTPETDADLTEESGSNGLCLERQAGLPEGHVRTGSHSGPPPGCARLRTGPQACARPSRSAPNPG